MDIPCYKADLHCHTTASDGLLRPEEVVKIAAKKGLKALGITDHDTVEGWQEAEKAGKKYGIKVVKGIEINTDWNEKEVHIIGYELDRESASLQKHLLDLREKRKKRVEKILYKLKELGFEIPFKEVLKYVKGDSIGRPHIAQAMISRGYVQNFREAFDKYLRIGAPAYVPRYKLDPEEAIKIVRESGGVAVLAHPGAQELEGEIYRWKRVGLQGLEVIHPEHSDEDIKKYQSIARQLELIMTGGSDFHGEGVKPGIIIGKWGIGMDAVEQIEKLTAQKTMV